MRIWRVYLALCLFASSVWGAGPALVVRSGQVRPSQTQMAKWEEAYWSTEEEVWAFPDKREAEAVIRHGDVPLEIQDALFATQFEMTPEERNKFGWQGNYQTNFLLKIPPALRDRLPASLIERYVVFYRLEMRSRTVISWDVTSEESWNELLASQRDRLSPAAFERFTRSSVKDGGTYRVLITPYSWGSLPPSAKEHFLNRKLQVSAFREGLEVKVRVGEADAEEVGAWISPSGRYSKEIAQKLKQWPGEAEVALEEILPEVVKANLNRYSEAHGPDCFGAAKAFVEGSTKIEAIDSGKELVASLRAAGFSPVAKGTPLELGDVLYYEDARSGGIHASVYLIDGIVFTKNGSSRTYPAIFQTREMNERIYSGDLRFRLTVFRSQGNAAPVVSNPYYYAHPLEEFSGLFIDVRAGRWARSGALRLIGLHRLSESAEADLRRYAVDPRFADTRVQAEAILLKHDRVVSHDSVARRIGFHAYDHDEKNFEALKKLAFQSSLSADELRFVDWVAAEWPYRYRHELRAISQEHDLGIPFTGVCRLVRKALESVLP